MFAACGNRASGADDADLGADAAGDVGADSAVAVAADAMGDAEVALAPNQDAASPGATDAVDATSDATQPIAKVDCDAPGVADGALCDDGNGCTYLDACASGSCIGLPKTCDDGNACTADSCDGGYCVFLPGSATICDDGNPCTSGDACSAGACSGMFTCDDGDPCTADICDDLAGGCLHAAIDKDGDGFGPGAACGGDCDDTVTAIAPDITEVCGNGVDENCDGKTDDGCPTPCAKPGFAPPACTDCLDGYVSVASGAGPVCAPDTPIWGPRPLNASAYLKDNGDGTVSDSQTKLMWQQEPWTGTAGSVVWAVANQKCTELTFAGHADWRLPTVAEVFTLLDFAKVYPDLISAGILSQPTVGFWTAVSGTRPDGYPIVWILEFSQGFVFSAVGKDYYALGHVRCVR